MAKLRLYLDGERKRLVVEGTGDVTNAEILSVTDSPNSQPQHTTVVMQLMTPAECRAREELRSVAIARRVSSNLGSAECQTTLATSGFDQERGHQAAEDILKRQAEKPRG